jgi:SSS family solute:Na+ symporter
MTPLLILSVFLIYTILLFAVTWFTARKADSQSFFIGNKISPWFVVAYGMIGASLSGVTFMSVPGWVKDTQFSYMIVVLGYLVGYFVIALVLLPLYYRLKLTSILSRSTVWLLVIQNRCRILYYFKDPGCLVAYVPCY